MQRLQLPITGLPCSILCTRTSFLMRTRNPCTPWFCRPISSCANTTANLASTAELVIQYFCASVVGVSITNSSCAGSKVAVVCISTALLPVQSEEGGQQTTLRFDGSKWKGLAVDAASPGSVQGVRHACDASCRWPHTFLTHPKVPECLTVRNCVVVGAY
jgi:hypothetical protein